MKKSGHPTSFEELSNESKPHGTCSFAVERFSKKASPEIPSLPLDTLRRSGSRYQALCPFHDDTNPSLVIFPNTGTYFCFGCQAKGRAILEGFSYVLYPWGSKNIPYTEHARHGVKMIEPPQLTEDRKHVLSSATLSYYALLREPQGSSAFTYLTVDRGLDPSALKIFAIGYANGKTLPSTRSYRELGLVRADGEDFFSSCILYPNFDIEEPGKVTYITGRGYPEKKHLRPPSSCLKRNSLYLEAFAREHKKIAIIVEGEADTITLRQAGLNAMGLYGVHSFDESDATRARETFELVIVALDGDEAGKKASYKIAGLIGPKARVLSFPEEFKKPDGSPVKDWNELFVYHFNKNVGAFRGYVEGLVDYLVSGWDYLEDRGTLSQSPARVRNEENYGGEMASLRGYREKTEGVESKKIAKEIDSEEEEGDKYAVEQCCKEVEEKKSRQQQRFEERQEEKKARQHCCNKKKKEKKRRGKGDLLEKHYQFIRGEFRWGAYRDVLEEACRFWALSCMCKGTLHDCRPVDHAPWVKHSLFKRCACGDKDHCILCGDTYSGERADSVIEPMVLIAEKWREIAPHQPIYATRLVITLPWQIWHKVDFTSFRDFEDAVSEGLNEYYKGASCPHYVNRHYWHSKTPVVTGYLVGGAVGTALDYTMAKFWHPHLHMCLVNVLKDGKEFIWTKPYLDEEKFKIKLGKQIAEKFDIPYVIETKKVRKGKKKNKVVERFYYILDGKKVAINLRINGYIPVNNEKFIIKTGKDKGKPAEFTNIEYLRGRLRYDCRQPNFDIAEFAEINGIKKFTKEEKEVVNSIIDGPPKNWKRGKWRGWLADSWKVRNLAKLGIFIKTKKEKKEELKKEPLMCPVHNKPTDLQFEGFKPRVVFPEELSKDDIILAVRYKLNGRYWVVKNNLNGKEITPKDIEMHIVPKEVVYGEAHPSCTEARSGRGKAFQGCGETHSGCAGAQGGRKAPKEVNRAPRV